MELEQVLDEFKEKKEKVMAIGWQWGTHLQLSTRHISQYKFALATPVTQKLLYSTEKKRDAGLLKA